MDIQTGPDPFPPNPMTRRKVCDTRIAFGMNVNFKFVINSTRELVALSRSSHQIIFLGFAQ